LIVAARYLSGTAILKTEELYRSLRKDTTANRKRIDSLQTALNKLSGNVIKEFKITGIKAITDTVSSVYNTSGIKTAVVYNSQIEYIYKLAVPLKYLAATINNGEKFSYHITMDVPPDSESDTIVGRPIPEMANGKIYIDMNNPDDGYRFSATDFWGEYTLAKK